MKSDQKDFANEMTVHNTREHNLTTEGEITKEHVENNSQVRAAMGARGIVPENLPAAEDVKKVERRLAQDAKKLPRAPSLRPPDEDGSKP
jgi:DNA-damage-inducible protein D